MSTRTANGDEVPWYRPVADECEVFERAHALRTLLLLKGPTGCGKSRLVEHMAARLGRLLVTSSSRRDRRSISRGVICSRAATRFQQDGPVTRAVRSGAILYLDEFAEARSDVVVVVHPLADHRRQLHLDRRDETLEAPDEFMLVVSFNPGYQRGLKELKPSTRQRFVALSFDYPEPEVEREILIGETGVGADHARRLVALAGKLRARDPRGWRSVRRTAARECAARLLEAGSPPRGAAWVTGRSSRR
ncbi:MAG: AAA family ATPase [Myxococcota bacterium]